MKKLTSKFKKLNIKAQIPNTKYKIQNTRRLRLFVVFLTIVFIIPIAIVIFLTPTQTAEASWWNDHWMYRKSIPVTYSGSENLTDYQVLVDGLDTATLVTAGKMQSDCDDLRFTNQGGNLLNYSIVAESCNTADTEIWVKTDSIPAEDITIYMYYGNPSASSYQSEAATFSYSSEKTVGYVLGDRYAGLDVIGLENGASVSHNSTTLNLDNNETGTIVPSNYGEVTATRLFNIHDAPDGTDMIVPVSWAGTEFIDQTRASGGSEEYFVVSPWGSATVRLYVAGAEQDGCGSPWTVTDTGSALSCEIADSTQFRITSDIPVLVFQDANAIDPYPMYPATSDYLYGINSSSTYVAAGPNGADVRYIYSGKADPEVDPADLGANGSTASYDAGGASYYSGDTHRFYTTSSSDPIGVTAKGDGDGGDGTVFVRRREFGTKFGAALQADFIAVVSDQAATCTVYDTDGSQLEQKTLTSSNTDVYELPATTDFGRGDGDPFTTTQWTMECDKQVYAVYQYSGDGGERNLWTYPMMRQFTYPTPAVGSLGSEENSPGPVAYWNLDEGYGTTANDYTENNQDGTISNATWQSEDMCVSGKCLYFDGTDDYITVSNDSEVDLVGAFSISLWFKPNSFDNNHWLFRKIDGGDCAVPETGWGLWVTTSGYMQYIDGGGGCTATASTTALSENEWSYLTVTYDGSTTLTYYVNGAQAGTSTENVPVDSAADLLIGYKDGADANDTHGYLDEVKIYPYARSEDEIRMDYIRGAGASGSAAVFGAEDTRYLNDGLVAYWKMDESSGDAADSSGNANTGTWSGSGSHYPSAKFGNGGGFNGTDDFITAGSSSSIKPTDRITVSAWINLSSCKNWNSIAGFNSWARGYWFQSNSNCAVQVNLEDVVAYSTFTTSNNIISTNTWQHVVFTYDKDKGNNNANIYVDGVLAKSLTSTGSISYTDSTLYLGKSSTYFIGGSMDELRVYNRALSEREVRDLYNWAPGPNAHWKMDEGSWSGNGAVEDTSANGTELTHKGDSTPTSGGKYGKAALFDGTGDYLCSDANSDGTCDDDGDLDMGTGSYTIDGWFKHTTIASNPDYIISKAEAGTNAGYKIYMASDGDIVFEIDDDATWDPDDSVTSTTADYDDDTWHHFAAVKDGTDGIYLYLDGVEIDSDETIEASGSLANDDVFYVGIDDDGSSNPWDGMIDDLRFYNYARTSGQIVQDMNAGHPAPGSPAGSPVGYWKFDEGYGSTPNDSSPHGNDASGFTGTPSWTNEGKFNKALSFDSEDAAGEYVTVPYDSSLNIFANTDWTVSVWVKPTTGTGNAYTVVQGTSHKPRIYINTTTAALQGYVSAVFETIVSTTGITSDEWNHVVFWADGNYNKIYINGIEKGSAAYQQLDSPFAALRIGASGWNTENFYGEIDELKFYNLSLTEDQIKQEYNQGKGIVMGSTGTDSSGNPDWSSDREYCVPGDSTSCSAPVAEWKFDENTGTSSIYDTSGNGRTGSLNGSMTESDWVTGKHGSALDFDGSDDYVRLTDDTFNSLSSGTITAWVYVKDSSSNYIITGNDSADSNQYRTYLGLNGNEIFYTVKTTSEVLDATTSTSGSVTSNAWHHVAFTVDSNGNNFYIDGVELKSSQITYATGSSSTQAFFSHGVGLGSGTGYYAIATLWGGSWPGYSPFNGQLDQIRVYSGALSAAQIAWDYNRGAPVGWWKMDECEGDTLNDVSANSNNGTLTVGGSGTQDGIGTCTDGDSTNAWYNGRSGQWDASLNFDGSDDYVETDDASGLSATRGSVSAWFKHANSGSGNEMVFSHRGTVSGDDRTYIYIDSSDNLLVSLGSTTEDTGVDISSATWYNVVLTWDSGTYYVFVDGQQVKTSSYSDFANIASCVTFGVYNNSCNGTLNSYFDGQIDDMRIYNYALTEDQVRDVYNEGSSVRFGD